MCGIAGMTAVFPGGQLPADSSVYVRSMTDTMRYRGPDGDGLWSSDGVCLGHRRLSIIDLAGGGQPMHDARGTLTITFNGEIYNFREIRSQLEAEGAHFLSHSDTEVILEAYRHWGTSCVDRFNGMFAFALWDGEKKRLFCARDRFGKKPFFYTVQNGIFVFASELSCLRRIPWLRLTPDPHAVMRYLAYQYVPCPDTMFIEVKQIAPAHALVLENGSIHSFSYWELPPADDRSTISEKEASGELRRLMTQAVRRRMISDVPLGLFLSGGIDSSIVCGLMAGISDKPVETFSIGFKEASFDETSYARCVAQAFATHHHERILYASECADILPDIVSRMDVPMADASVAPTWLLSKVTRGKVTVALGGDGSDELWAGYEHYIGFALAQKYRSLPQFLRKGILEPLCRRLPASHGYINLNLAAHNFLCAAAQPAWLRIQAMLTAFTPEMQEELLCHPDKSFLEKERLFAPTLSDFTHWQNATPLQRAFNVYAHEFLLDDILVKVDRCSMLNSLEVRAPFLDRDVAEFVARLPVRFKLHGLKRKYLLKKTFADLLPEKILHRNKRGFQIPVSEWLSGRLRPLMEDLLSGESLRRSGFFRPEVVRRLMDDHISGKKDLRVPLWTLMVFQLWWQSNVERHTD